MCQQVLEFDKLWTPLHKPLCDAVFSAPEISLWLIPRGHLKTSVITQAHAIQLKLIDPNCTILIDTAKLGVTLTMMDAIRGFFTRDSRLTFLFPDYQLDEKARGRRDEFSLPCRTRWTAKESCFTGASVDSSQVSKHFHFMFLDDLVSDKNIKTVEAMEAVRSHWQNLFPLIHPGGKQFIIGTRWDPEDLYGQIIRDARGEEAYSEDDSDAIADDIQITVRAAIEKDPQTGRRVPIFPQTDDGKPEFSLQYLSKLAQGNRMGQFRFSCNPGDAPVLMADWSIKRFDEIRAGDRVMGFTFGDGKRRRLCPTIVKEVRSKQSDVVRVGTDAGRVIRCTADHHWFTGRWGQDADCAIRSPNYERSPYAPARVGGPMFECFNPKDIQADGDEILWGWLGGMIDGEGAVKYGSITIHQSPKQNPDVCLMIEEVLSKLGIPFTIHRAEKGNAYVINGGRAEKMRIMANAPMAKRADLARSMGMGRPFTKQKVEWISPAGRETVYSMQTGTGNYIVHGFASRNCQYLNDPIPDAENRILHPDQVIYTDRVPKGCYHYIFVDPAVSTREDSDRAAIVCLAVDHTRTFYVYDVIAGPHNAATVARWIHEFSMKYNPIGIYMETNAWQDMYREYVEMLISELGGSVRIAHSERRTGDTAIGRILGLQPLFEAGRIQWVRGGRGIEDAIKECKNWSKRRAKQGRDDVCSALSDAPRHCMFPARPKSEREWSITDHWHGLRMAEIAKPEMKIASARWSA